jgi:hypothetical protein
MIRIIGSKIRVQAKTHLNKGHLVTESDIKRPKNPTEAQEIRENTPEGAVIFESGLWMSRKAYDYACRPDDVLSGRIWSVCNLCHHVTREPETEENHAFDCENR